MFLATSSSKGGGEKEGRDQGWSQGVWTVTCGSGGAAVALSSELVPAAPDVEVRVGGLGEGTHRRTADGWCRREGKRVRRGGGRVLQGRSLTAKEESGVKEESGARGET
jgi:hypothetical protein